MPDMRVMLYTMNAVWSYIAGVPDVSVILSLHSCTGAFLGQHFRVRIPFDPGLKTN